jgi:hypothetical protein
MADISRWVSLAEQSLRRLRENRTVLGFAITHEGDEPRLAITVPFPTDERALGFDAWRVQMAQKQIRAVLPPSIPFQIVSRPTLQDRG